MKENFIKLKTKLNNKKAMIYLKFKNVINIKFGI